MNEKTRRSQWRLWWIAPVAVPILLALLLANIAPEERRTRAILRDGTVIELGMVAFTNSYTYTQAVGPAWARRFSKFIPDFIENRFVNQGGTIGLGNTVESNLMVAFEVHCPGGQPPEMSFLRVADDEGNEFDGASVNGELSSGNALVNVWLLRTHPRRTRFLDLSPLLVLPDGSWTNIGPFRIENPRFSEYPQWRPEPLPQSRTNGSLVARLELLQSGGVASGLADAKPMAAQPKSTRVEFSFVESGAKTDHYQIYRLAIADSTGNEWQPVPSPFSLGSGSFITNGVAGFMGALWPGEDAWKIKLQALRSANFKAEEVWDVPPISLPNAQLHEELTNRFELDGLSIQLANILAPGVEVTNSWQWIVRHWGQEQRVYGLGIQFDGEIKDRRLHVVRAVDQAGNDFQLINHRYVDRPKQGFFLKAPPGATELRMRLAFPELKGFEFLARPEFVAVTNEDEAK